jgi:hypothetical protein
MYTTQRYCKSISSKNGIAMKGWGGVAGRIISSRAKREFRPRWEIWELTG